jgi:hypothetical protein
VSGLINLKRLKVGNTGPAILKYEAECLSEYLDPKLHSQNFAYGKRMLAQRDGVTRTL